jgi:hypothetical protein
MHLEKSMIFTFAKSHLEHVHIEYFFFTVHHNDVLVCTAHDNNVLACTLAIARVNAWIGP